MNSTIHGSTVLGGGEGAGGYVIADVYCVVRPIMVTAGLNMYTLSFLEMFL